ncbi:MAG: amino acid ABC transporter ATP-binding protein [Hyphomicrobiales bacterium]|nr:amino acid ABC transporter ATP-binding protein [Hyphomicrobiales bacterium]
MDSRDAPPSSASPEQAYLSVRRIKKKFGDLAVLNGVSLEAPEHEVVSLIGASGSGKSTLLRCINLLTIPDEGDVWIDGVRLPLSDPSRPPRRITDKKAVRLARARLAMVFQSFNLWAHRTILENVTEGPIHVLGVSAAEAREKATALLDRVGIADKRDFYPAQLSGGQQQRAAIARALAMEPKILLFDEPTSALDPELVGEVLKVMRDLADEGRTMIVVSHEMSFVRDVSNKVVFLHQGCIVEEGGPAEIFQSPKTEACRKFLSSVIQ